LCLKGVVEAFLNGEATDGKALIDREVLINDVPFL